MDRGLLPGRMPGRNQAMVACATAGAWIVLMIVLVLCVPADADAKLQVGADRAMPNIGMTGVEQLLGLHCSSAKFGTDEFFDCKHLHRAVYGDRGLNACLPDPRVVFDARYYGTSVALPRSVIDTRDFGWHFYYSAHSGAYDYGVRVKLQLYFNSALAAEPAEMASIDRRLREASQMWTNNAPFRGVEFQFVRVTNPRLAHYALDYKAGNGRGPSHIVWYTRWSARTFAHEAGHLLGLHDEYAEFDQDHQERHCSERSLMCNNHSRVAVPRSYHYYTVLRRIFCAGTVPSEPAWPAL